VEFNLGGIVRLAAPSDLPDLTRAIARQMDPYPSQPDTGGSGPTVALEIGQAGPMDELQHRAGDGLVTGWDGSTLFAVAGTHHASVPDAYRDEPAVVHLQPRFPLGRHFRNVVRPALQLRALASSSLAVHAASVDTDEGAILVAGWSESGKTETALALVEEDRRFLSDKWTLVTSSPEARAVAFPINVGVRRWVLRYLPRLRAGLPRRARFQVAVAGAAATVSAPVRSLRRTGAMLGDAATRAVALADRAALAPSEVARAYGHDPILQPRPIRLIVALRSVPGSDVRTREPDLDRLAIRLATTAAAERQVYWAYRERAAYAAGRVETDRAEVIACEIGLLRALLDNVPSVEVEAPFPIDPRRVVAALEPWLSER
jgi:hypothetical protein